ncbi:MAG: PAS domain S-box protein, partial [Bacteroidetes bacterium]|nr:PAS domain S-box protein [Bacteroidota bacterium]
MPFSEVPGPPGAARRANGASGSPLTGFWTATPGSPAQYWSPEMFDLLGYGASEVMPSAATWLAAIHPDDRAAVAALWENPGAEVEAVLFRVVQPSGRERPLTARRHATSTGDGAPATIMGVVQQRTPQKPLEERLRMLESVVVNANDAVVITEAEPIDGPEGPRIVYVNAAFLRNTGYSAGEVIGQTPRMFQGPDTDRATLDTIRTALERWEPVRAELLNYRKDGSPFWVEVEIVPVADGDGWYTHWVSVQRDVTERKAAEQRLEASEQRFRGLVANLPGLVYRCTYDTAWDTLYMSEGILDLSGYSREAFEELNRSFKDIVVPDDLPRIRAAVRAAVAAGQAYEIEYRVRHRDGTTRWVLDKGQATIDEHGTVAWLDGVMFDITARREAEERLRLMETAVEDTTESVLITDTQLDRPGPRIVHVNPGFERLTGYTAEDAIGQTPRILQGEATDPDLLVHLREQLEAGEPFFGETVNYRKDGTPFINEWSISPARNEKGEITHFVAVQRDVTEQREYENRIRAALGKERELSDLKTQFISMTSHEFRTPMSTILASADLLERYGARWQHDKQVTHLRRIQSAVHTMRELLDDVLVIGRSDAGKLA